jgi:hypothetical protein
MQRSVSKRKDDPAELAAPEKEAKPDKKPKKAGNRGRFQPGHKLSGGARGPIGKLAKRFLTAAVIDRLQQVEKVKGQKGAGIVALHKLADVLVQKAIQGEDMHAIREVFDRVEGRPVQAVELSGVNGKPFETINRQMTPDEAARAYAQTLIEPDAEEPDEDEGKGGGK